MLKNAGQCYMHLLYDEFILKFFFWDETYLRLEIGHKGEKYSLRNTSRVQNIDLVD